jgi:protein-S-isoprenylcysteine O-methyltransferase Ste14
LIDAVLWLFGLVRRSVEWLLAETMGITGAVFVVVGFLLALLFWGTLAKAKKLLPLREKGREPVWG